MPQIRFKSLSRWVFLPLALFCLLTLFAQQVLAQDFSFKKLMMPGEVIAGHAELEGDCSNCHTSFRKTAQNSLCSDCHKEIQKDISSKSGFHGKIDNSNCTSCHTDHKGRDKDIIGLDTDAFDHSLTDFALDGEHVDVNCDSCHLPNKLFREAANECTDCHEKDDPHGDKLSNQCADCHSTDSWQRGKFDHGSTDFPLKGAHEEVNCAACHATQQFADVATDCYSCHAISDVHNGKNGRDCTRCHNESRWDKILFDHARDTDFALRGKHENLACNTCHQQAKFEDSPGDECVDCHRSDDQHNGKNGKQCADCHNTSSWSKVAFEHARETNWPLRGKHAEQACEACHKGSLEDKLASNCFDCHALDDVHKGQEGEQCDRCHNEQGWGEDIVFDHDLTRFPLLGLHAAAPCEACHLSSSFKDVEHACITCHEADDYHKASLGDQCQQCHTPNAWDVWEFDHATQTHFPLEGKHEGLSCNACHKKPARRNKVRLSALCYNCHRDDDVHNGSFGKYCDRCHTSEDFSDTQKLLKR